MDAVTKKLTELRDTYRCGLNYDVLPFWLKHALDSEHGGFFTSLDRDGSLLDSDKSIWFQGRFAWLLSAQFNRAESKDEQWLDAARSGLKFLDQHGTDPADGLMWFQVCADGTPLRKRRYRFSETFACLANAEFYRATGEEDRAEKAASLFETFWQHWKNPGLSPFPPKFTGARPSKSLGAPMMGLNMAQVCREAGISGDWDSRIDGCIAEIESDFVHDDIECVMETVAEDGSRIENHFDGRTLNPGHAIEAAWFIMQEAKHRNNDPRLIALGCKMLDWMWKRGWDSEFGGVLYFVGFDGRPVQEYWHDMKFWWPHNEAIIATLFAYSLTKNEKYAAMHEQVHDWTYAHFPDAEYGEWFGYLNRDGSVSNPAKGNLWKGPFHVPRMQLIAGDLCESLLT